MGNKYCHEKKSVQPSVADLSLITQQGSTKENLPRLESACFATITTEGCLRTLGHYRLGDKIGIGSYGVVYMASHPSTSQQFAVKCVNKQKVLMSGHKKTMEHLLTEIEVMSTIKSDNIIRLYDIYQDQTNYYLIIDYCNKGDFLNYLQKMNMNYLDETEAVYFLKQLRNAFIELRKNRVMHRDIKLENMFIHDKTLKLGDFGFAKIRKDTANSILGSKYTMAPEILMGMEKTVSYGPKCDLWSIGCVFYEMLFGQKLPLDIQGDGGIQSIAKSLRRFNESELQLPRPITPQAEDLLRRLLTKNVQERIDFEGFFSHPIFVSVNEGNKGSQTNMNRDLIFVMGQKNQNHKGF